MSEEIVKTHLLKSKGQMDYEDKDNWILDIYQNRNMFSTCVTKLR